jgi:hypothetical protein
MPDLSSRCRDVLAVAFATLPQDDATQIALGEQLWRVLIQQILELAERSPASRDLWIRRLFRLRDQLESIGSDPDDTQWDVNA